MCGRFILYSDEEYEEIQNIINDIEGDLTRLKMGEIFPSDYAPAIFSNKSKRTASLFKWGFPAYGSRKSMLINARGETVFEKPTFRKLTYENRCLIPAVGFYEWKKHDKTKDKYLIKPEEEKVFYMAGLYNSFKDYSGELYNSFVIITVKANDEMSDIHDRMPVILDTNEAASDWIDNSLQDTSLITSYIHPFRNHLSIKKIQNNANKQLAFDI